MLQTARNNGLSTASGELPEVTGMQKYGFTEGKTTTRFTVRTNKKQCCVRVDDAVLFAFNKKNPEANLSRILENALLSDLTVDELNAAFGRITGHDVSKLYDVRPLQSFHSDTRITTKENDDE